MNITTFYHQTKNKKNNQLFNGVIKEQFEHVPEVFAAMIHTRFDRAKHPFRNR
jgi:hypothetical protein